MLKFKSTAVAGALLASLAASAGAMEQIEDAQLGAVTGQDGVSIVADMAINVASVEYGDSSRGTSLAFQDINVDGMLAATIDVLTGDEFLGAALGAIGSYGVADAMGVGLEAATALGYVLGSDVVQVAFPEMTHPEASAIAPSMTVASIATGNGGASMGSLAVRNFDASGTKVWIFGH